MSQYVFLRALCVSASLLIVQSPAQAVTEVRINGGTATTYAAGSDITITPSSSGLQTVRVRAAPSSESIGRISIGGSGSNRVDVILSADLFAPVGTGGVASACNNWKGIDPGSRNVRLTGAISGALTNGVLVSNLQRLDVDGEVRAGIVSGLNASDEGGPCYVVAGSVTSSGSVQARAGNITLVRTTAGNILGDISSQRGQITTIESASDIGSTTTPVTIEAYTLIDTLTAANVFADIDPKTQTTALDGSLQGLTITGDFSGSLRLGTFTTFKIGRSLLGNVEMPANALSSLRRIFLNNANSSGSWTGNVKVGSVTLSPAPQYAQTTASLGGGSVGLAPFGVHGVDCVPADGANVAVGLNSVKVKFYGPVRWSSTPMKLQRRLQGVGSFVDHTGSGCVPTFSQADGSSPDDTSLITVSFPGYSFLNGYEYRLVPLSALKSDLGLGASDPTVDLTDSLTFSVGNTCLPDFNGDGVINNAELSVLLANFNTSDAECGQGGDTNGDNVCNGSDLSVLLSLFDGFCPGGSSFSQGSGVSPQILEEFGFANAEQYLEYVNSLSPSELADHFARVAELLTQ